MGNALKHLKLHPWVHSVNSAVQIVQHICAVPADSQKFQCSAESSHLPSQYSMGQGKLACFKEQLLLNGLYCLILLQLTPSCVFCTIALIFFRLFSFSSAGSQISTCVCHTQQNFRFPAPISADCIFCRSCLQLHSADTKEEPRPICLAASSNLYVWCFEWTKRRRAASTSSCTQNLGLGTCIKIGTRIVWRKFAIDRMVKMVLAKRNPQTNGSSCKR